MLKITERSALLRRELAEVQQLQAETGAAMYQDVTVKEGDDNPFVEVGQVYREGIPDKVQFDVLHARTLALDKRRLALAAQIAELESAEYITFAAATLESL